MTDPEPLPRLLTLAEAQEILGVGKTKMYELINSGAIKTVLQPTPGGARVKRRIGERGPRATRKVEESEIRRYIADNADDCAATP